MAKRTRKEAVEDGAAPLDKKASAPPQVPHPASSALTLELVLDALAKRVADHLAVNLQAETFHGWIDQHQSPLGPRRHISAIRSGALKGFTLGRKHLAKAEDVEAYLQRLAEDSRDQEEPAEDKALPETPDALADELGLERKR